MELSSYLAMKATKVYGVLWQIDRLTNQPEVGLHKILRRQFLRTAFLSGSQLDKHGNMPFTITMPCGSSITYPDVDDIPIRDVPCPCGNSTHWLVKYENHWVNRN